MPMNRKLYVISGPSGVGKGTICKQLVSRNESIKLSISATTRKPREGDIDGESYYFKTVEQFTEMINNGEMLEWAIYNGNYYGTPKPAVEKMVSEGLNVILEIDTQGALQVKENLPYCVLIFIKPPKFETLTERLRERGTEGEDEIEQRVNAAIKEMECIDEYDYIIVNDDLEKAICDVENIIENRGEMQI